MAELRNLCGDTVPTYLVMDRIHSDVHRQGNTLRSKPALQACCLNNCLRQRVPSAVPCRGSLLCFIRALLRSVGTGHYQLGTCKGGEPGSPGRHTVLFFYVILGEGKGTQCWEIVKIYFLVVLLKNFVVFWREVTIINLQNFLSPWHQGLTSLGCI